MGRRAMGDEMEREGTQRRVAAAVRVTLAAVAAAAVVVVVLCVF